MQTLEAMHEHYKAVRVRLGCSPPPKIVVSPPKVEDAPPSPPIAVAPTPSAILTASQIILAEVAFKHKMTVAELKSKSHKQKYVYARQEAAFRLKGELKFSLSKIGRVLGHRDHTTALHAIRRYEARTQGEQNV